MISRLFSGRNRFRVSAYHDINFPGNPSEREQVFGRRLGDVEVVGRVDRPADGAVAYLDLVRSTDQAVPRNFKE